MTICLLGVTLRFEDIVEPGASIAYHTPPPLIYGIWHRCMLACAWRFRQGGIRILVSRSFDGELITRILRMFGFDAVRGSSSRSAREGLLGLKTVIETGRTAIFTADGPRGPIYETKMGPIKLAQATGAPIGAFHLQPERAWTMNSWDRFLVPKPFTRIIVSWAQWTRVPSDLPADGFEAMRQQLNDAIECARLRALAHLGQQAS
jgi:lysophospholipid acyltransferase (LPLAT)-like uncharacterized protein